MAKSVDNGFVKLISGLLLASIKIKALKDNVYSHDNSYHWSAVYHDVYDFVYGKNNCDPIILHEEFENINK